MSELRGAKRRWICRECGHVCFDEYILEAPHPFDPEGFVAGCPECKSVDSFISACASEDCRNEASGGHPGAFGFRYLWLCWEHSPTNPKGKTPKIVAREVVNERFH